MNYLNDSGEFQEVESNFCGKISDVSNQPARIPRPRSMLSCDKRLPPDTWNRSGSQEKVFATPRSTLESSKTLFRGIHQFCDTKCYRWGSGAQQERKNELETQSQMPTFAFTVLWLDSKDSRYRNIDLINSLLHPHFLYWKVRFKNQVTTCSDFFRMQNQIFMEDYLTFPVSLQWFQVLVLCWAATNACLLTHGIHRDYRKTFVIMNFLRLIHTEIILKEFFLLHHKENEDQFLKLHGRRLFSQEINKMEARFPCRHLQEGRRLSSTVPVGGLSAEFCGWTAKTANFGAAIRQILP